MLIEQVVDICLQMTSWAQSRLFLGNVLNLGSLRKAKILPSFCLTKVFKIDRGSEFSGWKLLPTIENQRFLSC
jgi:hypothetical protein